MSGILDGLKGIWNFIVMIGEMVKHFNESLIEMFKMMLVVGYKVEFMIMSLPTWLTAFAMATLSISVIYLIVGRGNSK